MLFRSLAAARGLRLATAESCTGGMVAARLTDVPGSSESFIGGVVAYADEVKRAELAVPEELLHKPDLTSAERLVIERHPEIGFRMLESLGAEPVALWVLHHHEWWDGSGYPDGLAGRDIPLGSRIIIVADSYDAMTANPLFRQPLDREAALHELERGSGTQFDPHIVAAFVAAVGAPAAVGA